MSDTSGKIKIHKNPDRKESEQYKPYVPQYQVHGKDPGEYRGAVVPGGIEVAKPSTTNPREAKGAVLRQPYAAVTTSPVGRGRGPVPNVGNNMEHTWSSVDGEIVDDLSGEVIDPNQPMVDNNDFVTDQAMGYQSGFTASDIQAPPLYGSVTIEENMPDQTISTQGTGNLSSIIADLVDDMYLLIVDGTPICSGPKDLIEDQAKAFVFGEDAMCDGNPVPIDDIIILKRVKVKVGLFLE